MKEIIGNLFDYPVIVIPTNGIVKTDGRLVMGKGIALEAKNKYKNLDLYLGYQVNRHYNRCFVYYTIDNIIVSFPTKYHYKEKSCITLVERSTKELVEIANWFKLETIYLPKVGCGLGNLDWNKVKPLLERYLDDRFIVVSKE